MSTQPLFTVTATGETFRIKHDLREWDFDWYRDEKVWRAKRVREATVNMFRNWTRGAEWEGVELTVTPE